MYGAGLVLEGGGMRGLYTAGVLDFFLDQGILFEACYGVSAGICNAVSYIAGQKGRALAVNVDYLQDKRYAGVYSLLTTGDLFGVKMCYKEIPEKLNPYDYDTFEKYQGEVYAVVTNIRTGRPEYLRVRDMRTDIVKVRASASMPLVSRKVRIGREYYLDGGMSDSIPVVRSVQDGHQKNVVVMTKEVGYRREPTSHMWMIRRRYQKYPKLVEAMENRHLHYNKALDYIEKGVKEGTVFLIQPKEQGSVGRLEKDRMKLEALHREGYEDGERHYEGLRAFLEK